MKKLPNRRLRDVAKDNAGLLTIVSGLLILAGSFTQLEKMAWLIRVPSVAYAAQSQADETADQFERYLLEQRAATRALQDYTQQLQQQQTQQQWHPIRQTDQSGQAWCCDTTIDRCWSERTWYACQ